MTGDTSRSSPGARDALLVVDRARHWDVDGMNVSTQNVLRIVEFGTLDAEYLARSGVDLIFTPLVSAGFDCVELACRLDRWGYRGRLRVLGPALPDPALISAEIRACCPAIDVEFMDLSHPLAHADGGLLPEG